MSERKPSVFISYSHKDVEWKDKLVRQLQIPAEHHGFEVWHDGQIQVGDDWRERIGAALETTQIAVLLISAEFLNSTFIKTHEVPLLLELRQQGRVEIVPVLVGACPWKSVGWLERLELRPKDGEALENLSPPAANKVLVRVAEEIDAKLTQAVKKAAREQARSGAALPGPPGVAKAAQQPAPPSVGPRAEPSPPRPDPPKPAAPGPPPSPPQPVTGSTGRPGAVSTARPAGGGVRPVPSWLNAAVRSLPVWLIGVTALALGLYLWLWAKPEPVAPSPTSVAPTPTERLSLASTSQEIGLAPFEFETVRVDARGAVVERKRQSAPFYEEDLGGGVKLSMVEIPGGTFVMGSPQGEAGRFDDEGPQRTVTVAPFFLGKFEVTQAQWRAVAGWPQVARALAVAPWRFKGDDLPVASVSWDDAVEFCARLYRRTGRAYRLPSEAEWKYAARAGTETPFHFGETITPALVNYDGNYPYAQAAKGAYRKRTTPVGSFKVGNSFGLFDMHGNVWEWTLDASHPSYAGAPTDGSAWETGGDAARRVVRGGSWYINARYCRSACRNLNRTVYWYNYVGFRVLCSVARTR